MNNDKLLLIVLRAINQVGLEKFKSTSMFTKIREKREPQVQDIKDVA